MDLQRLLSKETWTGEDLGKIIIENEGIQTRQIKNGEEPKIIFDIEKFKDSFKRISKDKNEVQIYTRYNAVLSWAQNQQLTAKAFYQQALANHRYVQSRILSCLYSEDVYDYKQKWPRIVTQKQYDDLKEKARKEFFDGEGCGVFDLLIIAIGYYEKLLRDHPRKKNPLKEIRKEYSCKPVESRLILEQLNDYSDTPTKWSIALDLLDFYPADAHHSGDPASKENVKASIEDMRQEFPELIDAILQDIADKYFQEVLTIPMERWTEPLWSNTQLYNMRFYDIRDMLEDDTNIFSGDRRAIFCGVAILRKNDFHDFIDSDYTEPSIADSCVNRGLERYMPESEDYKESKKALENARETMIESIYHVKAYAAALELIAESYDVPDITALQIDQDIDSFESINEVIKLLKQRITGITYDDPTMRDRKEKAIADCFQPVVFSKIQVPAERKEAAKPFLKEFKAFIYYSDMQKFERIFDFPE